MSENMNGKTVLHYKILEKLGEGGMGIVYKAEDTKLNRLVAIKILPPHLLVSEDDRSRFNREAKAAAALNHSNIATVYEINETDSKPFIVMEYVPGATLDQTITKGPLKLEEAISITIQIADGLGAAHKKEVVHRDIKASNILLGEDNKAKILDFGLAKTSMSTKLTQMGTTIGTVAYMSPEQVQGKEVDHRTDLWSLGVLLYEMIAGQLPFKADYDQAIFYSIQNENPDPLTSIRTGIPMALEWIVNKLMAKDPTERYQSANDLIIDLKAVDLGDSGFSRISTTATHTVKQKASPKIKPNRERTVWFSLIAILIIVMILFGPWMGQTKQDPPVVRFGVDFTNDGNLSNTGIPLAVSPDGSKLVYSVNSKGLYIRYSYDLLNSLLIPGTERARNPVFSPDGNWIVFFDGGNIKKVSLLGGKPQTILKLKDEGNKTYQHWYTDNSIIFTQQYHKGIFQISAAGGLPKNFNEADSISDFVDAPQVLPDGKNVLLRRKTINDEVRKLVLFNTESGEFTTLLNSSGYARYIPTGHIIYGWKGDLWIVPFDVDKLKISGQAVPVIADVATKANGTSLYTVSDNGILFYPQGDIYKTGKLAKGYLEIKELSGTSEVITFPGRTGNPVISPNGKLCAFSVREENDWNLWLYDLKTKIARRLTDYKDSEAAAAWTVDGKSLIFITKEFTETYSIAIMPIDGSSQPEILYDSGYFDSYLSLTPDGKNLVFVRDNDKNQDILILPLDGTHKPKAYLQTTKNEGSPAISPDGKWIAYTSDESGQKEVYIGRFPGPPGFRQVSVDGGIDPCWAPDGRTLYFKKDGGKKLYKVSFKDQPELVIGNPQLLFENTDWGATGVFRDYDISPDGKYFIMRKDEKSESQIEQAQVQFVVVLNWFEELKTKMMSAEENHDW